VPETPGGPSGRRRPSSRAAFIAAVRQRRTL
jgi:hypothetical protein